MSTFMNAETKRITANGNDFTYRMIGDKGRPPLVMLHHFTAVLDDWDPRVVDGLGRDRSVTIIDNRGVGGSGGETPSTIEEMAEDTAAVIRALGHSKVDLLGFSMGGFQSQVILQKHPELVRKAILAGTGPAGDAALSNEGLVVEEAYAKAKASGKHPKHFLFFSQSKRGQTAADAFIKRLDERTMNRDEAVKPATVGAQLKAIENWGRGNPAGLKSVKHEVLVANGDNDLMVATAQSFELVRMLANAQLTIYPDAGHGAIFQYHDLFVEQALTFLE